MCQYIRKELTMMKGGARCNNTSCVNTSEKNWLWWRVVRDVTIHHVSIHQKRWWRVLLLWWALCWGGSRSTKHCVFPCKVAAGGDERYLVCATGAAGVISVANCSSYVFCKNGCSCVRTSMRFLKLWLQIALEWLHECCMGNVVGRKPEHETLCFSV